MKKVVFMKRGALVLIALIGLSVCGCFEMSEEIWFNDDGTGRLLIELKVSEGLMAMADLADSASAFADMDEVEEELKSDPNVEEVLTNEFTEAGMRHLVFDIKVKDYLKLAEVHQKSVASTESSSEFEAPFQITDLGDGKVRFKQSFAEKEVDDEFAESGEDMGTAMAAAMFADKYITITIHAPKVTSSNGEINEEENTTTWKIPLFEMMADEGSGYSPEADLDCSTSFGDKVKKLFK